MMTSEEEMDVITHEGLRLELSMLEEKYGMISEDFYKLWQRGNSPIEGVDKLRWVVFWEAWYAGEVASLRETQAVLVAACKVAVDIWGTDRDFFDWKRCLAQLRAAIAKAEPE